jgi:polyisoprenoid-binding protein YceI
MSTATTAPAAVRYTIDSNHSSAGFKIRHCMIAWLRGEFVGIAGEVVYDPSDPSHTEITAAIDATTFHTRENKRDAHMKGAEFFDVEKYPTINFKSTKVTPYGKNQWKIAGDLTMHGITKEVALDVESAGSDVKDTRGDFRTGASATTLIKRSDFGFGFNLPLETGGVFLSDEVHIDLEIELIKKS